MKNISYIIKSLFPALKKKLSLQEIMEKKNINKKEIMPRKSKLKFFREPLYNSLCSK